MRRASVALLLILASALLGSTGMAATGPAGAVAAYRGDAFAIGRIGTRKLHKGRSIYAGDMLVTGRNGRLRVRLRHGADITLGPGSRLALPTLYQGRPDNGRLTVIRLLKGVARLSISGSEPTDSVRIEGGNAVARMANGDIVVQQHGDPPGFGIALLAGGPVTIADPTGGSARLDQAGSGVTVAAGRDPGPVPITPWPDGPMRTAIDRASPLQ